MLGGLCVSLAATAADAREARYRLSIEPKSYAEALIDLGFQADVSVLGTSACGAGGGVSLKGDFTLEEALRRLTAGAPCSYRILDPRTVRIGPPAPAPAAETPKAPPTLVAELLVTATKRPAGINRLPAAISVIPHSQIALTGAEDVGETAAQASGVFTTNLGPGRDKVILRGLSDGAFTGHARSTVGSYLDDVPINYNAPDPDLRLVDVERIEVVRGPQGALYGSGALSGVYRIVTGKPNLAALETGLTGETAWTQGGSASRALEGYLSVPLVNDQLAVRLAGYYDLQGGYIDNLSLGLPNIDRTRRDGGRLALRYQPDEAWQADLSIISQRLRSDDTHYTTPSAGRNQRRSLVQEAHQNDFDEASLTVRGELGWATFRNVAALVEHVFSSDYDATAVLTGPKPVFTAPANSIGIYVEKTSIQMLVEDMVLRSSRPGRLTWLVGLYGASTLERSPSSLDAHAPNGRLKHEYDEQRRDRLQELAAYGEANYEFAPGWTLAVGGRLFDVDVRTGAKVFVNLPRASRSFLGESRATGFSPKLSLQHEFASGGLVYGLLSEGYRPGGFNTGGFLFPIRSSRVTFAPDHLRNFEVGYKTALFDHHLAVRTAVFLDTWTHIQSDQYRPSGLPFTVNIGDAKIEGVEAEAAYDWDFGLSVQANALLLNAQLKNPNTDFAAQLVNNLPSIPKSSGGVLAVYRRPLPRGLAMRLVAETSYVGRSDLSFDAANAPQMGEYFRSRLSAEVLGKGWSAMVFVTNPNNDAGNTFAYGNPFTFGQVRQSTPQRPRTFGLRLTTNY